MPDKVANSYLLGPGSRFICFVGDFSLGHLLYHFLFSFSWFAFIDRKLVRFVSGIGLPEFGPFRQEDWATFLLVYLTAQFLRLIVTCFLGVSLFQFIGGIRPKGQWAWLRMGGVSRVVLETVFGLTLIGHFPCFIKESSFYERLSGTYLRKSSNDLSILLVQRFMIPFFVIFVPFSPLLYQLTLIDGLVVVKEDTKKSKLEKSQNFDQFKNFKSKRYKLQAFSSLMNGRFVLIPDFDITKLKGKRRFTPFITIYDRKNEEVASWKVIGKLPMLKVIGAARRGNPYFSRRYPKLAEMLSKEQVGSFKKVISEEGRLEILDLIQSALELGVPGLVEHVLDQGPFIRGHVRLRQILLNVLGTSGEVEADYKKLGNHQFVRFRQTLDDKITFRAPYVETWIPLGTHNATIYEFSWGNDIRSGLSRKAFLESFFQGGEWFFDSPDLFEDPATESEMGPFQVVDWLTKNDLTASQTALTEEYLYRYYYALCRSFLEGSSEKMKRLIEKNISRVNHIIEVKNKEGKKSFSPLLVKQMKELEKAFRVKDKGHFNI